MTKETRNMNECCAVFSSYSFWFLYDRAALQDRRRDLLSPNASWWRLPRDVILPYFRQSGRTSCTHSFGDYVFRIHVCGHAPVVRYGPYFLPQRLVYFISVDQANRYTRLTRLYIQQERHRKLVVHDFMRVAVIFVLWVKKIILRDPCRIWVEFLIILWSFRFLVACLANYNYILLNFINNVIEQYESYVIREYLWYERRYERLNYFPKTNHTSGYLLNPSWNW